MGRARTGATGSRRARASLASLVGLCLGACLLVAGAPPSYANAALTPTSVSLGAAHVDVAGLAVAHVTVDVAATVDTFFFGPTDPLVARLVRTTPQPDESSPRYLWVLLPRTGGTDAAHGTWAGTLAVPSTANGAWRVDRVSNYIFTSGADPAPIETDPRSVGLPDSVLTVSGTHRPLLTLVQAPIVPLPRPRGALTYRFTATFRWSDTGRPVAGLAVTFDTDDHCLESTPPNRVTNASGVVTGSYSGVGIFCVTTPLPGTASDQLASSYYQRVIGSPLAAMRVSARLTTATIRLGAPASATGTVVGLYPALSWKRPTVLLQKLVGRTWRTVNSTTVRASGRYTLAVRPGTKGTAVYRVYLPTQRPYYRVVTAPLRLHVG